MTLTLTRTDFRPDGIMGALKDESGNQIAVTLEHSYDCKPKLYDGTFACVLGTHQLEGMTHTFQTYEITGVKGHSNILLHMGNWNKDSDGCVLLGKEVTESGQGIMITNSVATFNEFLASLNGAESFDLVVTSVVE